MKIIVIAVVGAVFLSFLRKIFGIEIVSDVVSYPFQVIIPFYMGWGYFIGNEIKKYLKS